MAMMKQGMGAALATKAKMKGKVDLAKLFSTMDSRSGGDRFKLNKAGTVRFRLVEPLGTDSIPMQPLDEHWIPYVKDDGKEGKRPVTCLELNDEFCPVCALHALLASSQVVDLEELGKEIRVGKRWLMYVVNRSYMMMQEEPTVVETMEKVEQANLPQTVAQAMVNLMRNRAWGDPTHPSNGYDIEVTGAAKGGKSQFTEYSVSPVPRDSSPAYSVDLVQNFKPLSELIEFRSLDDIYSFLEPVLATLASNGYDDLVEAFWAEASEAGSPVPGDEVEVEAEPEGEYEGDEGEGEYEGDEGEYENGDEVGDENEEENEEAPSAQTIEEDSSEGENYEAEESETNEAEGEEEPENFGTAVKLPGRAGASALRGAAQKPAAPAQAPVTRKAPAQAPAAPARKTPAQATMDKSVTSKEKPSNLLSTLSSIRKGKK